MSRLAAMLVHSRPGGRTWLERPPDRRSPCPPSSCGLRCTARLDPPAARTEPAGPSSARPFPYGADRRHAVDEAPDWTGGWPGRAGRRRPERGALPGGDARRNATGLDRRIADKKPRVEEVAAWQHDRNATHLKANSPFPASDARIKLKHPYPSS